MPRYRRTPLLDDPATELSYSQEIDQAFEAEVAAEVRATEARDRVEEASERTRIAVRDLSPYGARSEHSWVLDSIAARQVGRDPMATERLNRCRAAAEKQTRAVSSSTLTFLSSAVIEPWVAEAVAYGIRSTAPLSLALERLDLPPSGTKVWWAKVTTAATLTAGSQSAENAALSASTDPVVGSVGDQLQTVAGFVDFSAQSRDRSGGWFDMVIGEELGRAFGARLEQQLWNGSGSGGQLTGLLIMSGTSSSTVAGQTLAQQTAKIDAQFDAVAINLGSVPDLIALAPRRYAGLASLAAASGLPVEGVFPQPARQSIVVSPAAPINLGAGTNEDWIVLMNRASTPLVMNASPTVEFQQHQGGNALNYKLIIRAYVALGVSRRPEGVGLVKGFTAPSY